MKIHLLYQNSNNSKSKPYSFFLFNEQITFNKYKNEGALGRNLHISSLSFPSLIENNSILSIDIVLTNEKLFISSELNSQESLNSFRKILGYLKHLYFLNLSYDIFIRNQSRYFSPVKYTDKLSNYVNKYTFYRILKKINETNDLKGLFQAVSVKFEDYEQSIMPLFAKKKIDLKQSMMTDYKETFMTMYDNLSIKPDDYGRKSEIIVDPAINQLSKKYYDLGKILLEIRNSVIQICISKDYQLMTNDILLFYLLFKTKTNDIALLQKDNIMLNNKHSKAREINHLLKQKLSEIVRKKGNQIYYCFKCGLMLFKTNLTNANCRYDDKCTKYSMFNCPKCNVAYCTYCVSYYKNSKCPYNHLIFEFENIKSSQICSICFSQLGTGKDIAGCKICQFPMCNDCNKTRASFMTPNCMNCSNPLGWKRSKYAKCNKCHLTNECFWFCFYCCTQMCIGCQPTIKDYCGNLHQMKQNCFNEAFHQEFYSYLEKLCQFTDINDYMNHLHCQPNILCSKCKEVFPQRFISCQRCSFILCQSCLKDQS